MRTRTQDEAGRYLAALEDALRDVPRAGREEVLRDVRLHLQEVAAEEPGLPVASALDRLGPVEEVAAAARERYGTVGELGAREVGAVVALAIGGFVVPVLGWLVGVGLLWSSPRWTPEDKLLGTFVLPGGLAFPLLLLPVVVGLGVGAGVGTVELLVLGAVVIAVEAWVLTRLLRRARS